MAPGVLSPLVPFDRLDGNLKISISVSLNIRTPLSHFADPLARGPSARSAAAKATIAAARPLAGTLAVGSLAAKALIHKRGPLSAYATADESPPPARACRDNRLVLLLVMFSADIRAVLCSRV